MMCFLDNTTTYYIKILIIFLFNCNEIMFSTICSYCDES